MKSRPLCETTCSRRAAVVGDHRQVRGRGALRQPPAGWVEDHDADLAYQATIGAHDVAGPTPRLIQPSEHRNARLRPPTTPQRPRGWPRARRTRRARRAPAWASTPPTDVSAGGTLVSSISERDDRPEHPTSRMTTALRKCEGTMSTGRSTASRRAELFDPLTDAAAPRRASVVDLGHRPDHDRSTRGTHALPVGVRGRGLLDRTTWCEREAAARSLSTGAAAKVSSSRSGCVRGPTRGVVLGLD